MDNITVKLIVVDANAGSEVGACIRECMEISVKESIDVELTHNAKVYSIIHDALFASVTERPKS